MLHLVLSRHKASCALLGRAASQIGQEIHSISFLTVFTDGLTMALFVYNFMDTWRSGVGVLNYLYGRIQAGIFKSGRSVHFLCLIY